jgi:hypothetical protein
MTEFLIFCIATVGMTSIITQGVIFQPFRQFIGDWADQAATLREQKAQATGKLPRRQLIEWFSELINCAQCTGFWCGLFCGLFLVSSEPFLLHSNPNVWFDSSWTQFRLVYNNLSGWNRLLLWFCCGLGGSFLSALGCNLIDWVFYRKMNALRQLEEQDRVQAQRRENLEVRE